MHALEPSPSSVSNSCPSDPGSDFSSKDEWQQAYDIKDLEVLDKTGKYYMTYGGGPEGGYFESQRMLYSIERTWGIVCVPYPLWMTNTKHLGGLLYGTPMPYIEAVAVTSAR